MTTQAPDMIQIGSEQFLLLTYPLENYWIREGIKSPFLGYWTCCTRGYIASWKIENDTLLLTEINEFYEKNPKIFMESIFPNVKYVVANWFSGTLIIGKSENIKTPPKGFYQSSLHLELIEGQIVI